jgi:hypothetical protein
VGPVTDPLELRNATDVLGWVGTVVPQVKVLGVWADVVAHVDRVAHASRQASGQGPMLERDVLAMWEWPEARRAPEVVRLVGLLVGGTSWRRALTAACRLAGFGPVAILGVDDERCRLECSYFGVGLVAVDGASVRLVEAGRSGRSEGARRRTLDRWVEESVYARLIADGVLAPVATPSATR